MKKIVLIPTRLESKRLPGKALLDVDGLPIIVHTAKRSSLAKNVDEVYVCTDLPELSKPARIIDKVLPFPFVPAI